MRFALAVVLLICGCRACPLDAGPAAGAAEPGSAAADAGTFADGRTPERILHIDPQAAAGGDGSAARPFQTIAQASAQAVPGTALRLAPGEHRGGNAVADLVGSAEHPIWIGGEPGAAKPIVRGGTEGLHLSRVRFVVVHDLEIAGAAENGINCDDGGDYAGEPTSQVVFRDLAIHDIGDTGIQNGLKLSGVRDFQVLRCVIARCGADGSGIDHVGCHRGRIAGCTLGPLGASGIQVKGGSADIVIAGNRLSACGRRALNLGGNTGAAFFRPPLSTTAANAEARRIRAEANVIIGAEAAVAFVGALDCALVNNTIVDPGIWCVRILQETRSDGVHAFAACAGNRISNNIFSYARAQVRTCVNVGADTDAASTVLAHNAWFAHDQPDRSSPGTLPAAESGAVVGEDPLFVDPIAGDVRLRDASPVRSAGAPAQAPARDAVGRVFADPPSIGAYAADPITATPREPDRPRPAPGR